jgi:adenylate cyclase
MAAAGLLKSASDPLESAVLCGLQMATTSIDAQLGWVVRVGVHIGPVVAGIVGQERYQFDIWGDTVNIAARMAGKATPGGVAVTDETWRQIKDRFEGESLGDLDVKGKGTIRIVSVQARSAKPPDRDSKSISRPA